MLLQPRLFFSQYTTIYLYDYVYITAPSPYFEFQFKNYFYEFSFEKRLIALLRWDFPGPIHMYISMLTTSVCALLNISRNAITKVISTVSTLYVLGHF